MYHNRGPVHLELNVPFRLGSDVNMDTCGVKTARVDERSTRRMTIHIAGTRFPAGEMESVN